MWQWEDKGKQQKTAIKNEHAPALRAVPYAKEPDAVAPAAFAHFDVPGTNLSCEGI
jgi:type IV secretion system protein VirB7